VAADLAANKTVLLLDAAAAATSAAAAAASAAAALVSEGLADDDRIAAQAAQGLSEDARDASIVAQGLSEDARDDSIIAALASEAALDELTDLYLGSKSSDPALDNDGNALQDGALYHNTVSKELRFYDLGTTSWIALPAGTYLAITGGTLTGDLTMSRTGANATLEVDAPTGYDGVIALRENSVTSLKLFNDASNNDARLSKYESNGSSVASQMRFDEAGDIDVAIGQFKQGGKNVMVAGKHSVWIPANAMTPQETDGAAPGTIELSTNEVMLNTLDFDPTTREHAQFGIRMPKGWDEGSLTIIPVWSHPSTSTNFGVVWVINGRAVSNNDALDQAWGGGVSSVDVGGTTDRLYQGAESSALTLEGSPAEGDYA